MNCKKCGKQFNRITANCGTGYSWELYKCPHCNQLHAEKAGDNGFYPKEVIEDESIIKQ